MALKDWERVSKNAWTKTFDEVVEINQYSRALFPKKNNGKDYYVVAWDNRSDSVKICRSHWYRSEDFKTRAEAIKNAKSYMRKH